MVDDRGCSGQQPRHPAPASGFGYIRDFGRVFELFGELGVLELTEFSGQSFDGIDEVEFIAPFEEPCIPSGSFGFGALFEPVWFGLVDVGEQAFDLGCERVCLVKFPVCVWVLAAIGRGWIGGHFGTPSFLWYRIRRSWVWDRTSGMVRPIELGRRKR